MSHYVKRVRTRDYEPARPSRSTIGQTVISGIFDDRLDAQEEADAWRGTGNWDAKVVSLPAWDELTDLDKGAVLLHLHKVESEGAEYATEHYAARFFDHPALTDLDGPMASEYAQGIYTDWADSPEEIYDALGSAEYDRLYDMALAADRKRTWPR